MNPMAYVPMVLKTRARAALKRNFSAALMICFLASLPSLMAQAFITMATLKIAPVLNAFTDGVYVAYDEAAKGLMSAADLSAKLRALLDPLPGNMLAAAEWLPTAILVCFGLSLLLSFLHISQTYAELRLLRSETITAGDALSRVNCFFRAVGLELWRALWVFLWCLPGLAVMILGSLADSRSLFSFAYTTGMILTVGLAGRAVLRYLLAPCVMADKPEQGPVACVRESKTLMQGRVGRLLLVLLSFILAVLVINWVSAILEGLSPVVGLLASMFLSLIISLYTDTTVCAFYEQCVDDTAKAPVYTFDGPGGPGSGEGKTPLYPEDRQMNADEKEEKM
ncbi:MAG: DUF975 family protein [Clostridia bacterium]|nr:DUF975 family protein [Clostridia bacterium]